MATFNEVVTPERFESGYTWEGYLDTVKVNKERFERNYKATEIDSDEAGFFRGLEQEKGSPIKVLVVGEDWCPDVYANMPIMAKIAEAAGWEIRIFPRDENRDIMDLFLKDGNMSIPVFAFFDNDWNELGRWTERSAAAREFLIQLTKDMENSDLSEEDARKARGQRLSEAYNQRLRGETIREVRELLGG